ncbi:MAG: gliding motility-associated C-terminal domain-containing protein [Saprospiraceae bacterium]
MKIKQALYYLILVGILLPLFSIAQSNEGTDFWFTYLEHRDRTNKRKCIITSKYNTNGTIEIQASGWKVNFQVKANDVFIVDVPAESENLGSEKIFDSGVHVTTDLASSVYIHQFNTFRSDAALVLPSTSLGTQYYVMTYTGYLNEDDHYPSEFCVVGIEDNTSITLSYSATTVNGRKKNEKETIILNKGQTYQVQSRSVADDLTGTQIQSDKFVAVFSGNRWTQIPNGSGNRDNLLEQMYPVEVWGKQFVAVPSKNTSFDRYRILASEDNTKVQLFGTGSMPGPFSLMKGQWIEFQLNAKAAFIQSSKPIMTAMFLVGGSVNGLNGLGDPSMVLLNSVEQYRDTVTIYNSPYENITDNFINIITQTKDTSSLTVDGKTIPQRGDTFSLIGPAKEYAFAQLKVFSGAHLLISQGCGLIAIAYGYGQAESYAYGGGANFLKINQLDLPDGSCLHDTIFFNTGLSPQRYELNWDLGDGSTSKLHKFKYVYGALGNYTIKLIIHDLCRNSIDTIQKIIRITLRENLIAYPDTAICEGEELHFFAYDRDESKYIWTGPNNFYSETKDPVLKNLKPNQGGLYEVKGIFFGCPTYPIQLNLKVIENPRPFLGRDTFFCPSTAYYVLNVPSSYKILWEDNSSNTSHIVIKEGLYNVEITDEFGCVGSDSILILDKCPLVIYAPNVFSPNGDFINDEFKIIGSNIRLFQLEIFSRWGERVFLSKDIEEGWNGKLANGEFALPGVYVYYYKAEGYNTKGEYIQETFSGDLNLIR